MNGNEVIDLARRTYLEEFAHFVRKQASLFPRGAAEVQTVNAKNPALFGGHYRADYIGQRGEEHVPADLVPDNRVRLDTPLDGMSGAMQVRMEQIMWDDVVIAHDLPADLLKTRLQLWFDHWYDPDDRRKPADAGGATDVIHSVGVYPGKLAVDFGSASPSAFWALIAILRDAGATRLVIGESRPPPPKATH